jgi:LacI family transcriptional regulator
LAFGVLDAAREMGIGVPGELWVVGYDDVDMSSWPAFRLTTVKQNVAVMAGAAVDMLLRRSKTPSAPFRHVRFTGELVVRESTAMAEIPAPG